MISELKVRVFRYDPDVDAEPRYETYTVAYEKLMRVQDVLDGLIENQGVSLAYRWFCGAKKCGACGITLNGRSVLACWEPAVQEMTIEPMANFPIIRDLVVDISSYERFILALSPLIKRGETPSRFPEIISQDLMADAYKLMPCVECWACTAAVPVSNLGPDGVAWDEWPGTAALVVFAKAALDARDTLDRKPMAERARVNEFPHYPELADVCPSGINIVADAIMRVKEEYFGKEALKDAPKPEPHERIFVKARRWCGFVRLASAQKEGMVRHGRLRKQAYREIEEAYELTE